MIDEKYWLWALPVLLTALLGSVIYRKQKDKEKFDVAHEAFCAAFAAEFAFLVSDIKPDSSIHGTTYAILIKALNKHTYAVDVFGRMLPKRKRHSFNKAWEDYQYPNCYNEKADFPLLDYADGDDFEKRKLAHSKISLLLEIAKPK